MTLQIRQCETRDIPVVQPMFDDLYAQQQQPEHEEEPLLDRMSEFFLVVEDNDEIIGFVIAERRATVNLKDEMGKDAFPKDKEYLEVQDVYVAAAHRGRGVGTQMMQTLLQKARAAGLDRSMVYSANKDYVQIARFYERVGFRMWHIFMTQ
ncbi:MAG: GNAT family N-acetyltransferase [Phycisphaerae bacterium]|nr:GNAT family N-acetyltransferase [Phycisphaerae bacterium]